LTVSQKGSSSSGFLGNLGFTDVSVRSPFESDVDRSTVGSSDWKLGWYESETPKDEASLHVVKIQLQGPSGLRDAVNKEGRFIVLG